MDKNFYITTPIYYPSAKPHMGHAYSSIIADFFARFKRIQGFNVYFLTGTDEHGQKVQEAAKKNKTTPQEHVDKFAKRFKKAWSNINIEYSDFIRTTDKRHKDRVKDILNYLFSKGEIYKNEYEGLYSVSEERFITQKEADEGDFREVKKLKEKNYFFKMSKYQKQLIKHINSNPDFIQPESRKNEVLGFLNKDLQDLCISRPKKRLSWGIELPFDKEYVTYVWFDALINYISAIGWNSNQDKFNNCWPADYHLMAKDILTTHCVYWPTMLMACDIQLPKTIFAHGWWLIDNKKMSKSLGNAIKPLDLADKYGSDALRFYLMRNMVLGQDASYSYESFVEVYNAELANDYGNLVNRILILIHKYFDGKIPVSSNYNDLDLELIAKAKQIPIQIIENYNNLKLHNAIKLNIELFRSLNKYLELKSPWKSIKKDPNNKDDAASTLYIAIETLRIGTVLISPVMPEKAKELFNYLNLKNIYDYSFGYLKSGHKILKPNNMFPKIEI